MNIDFTEKLMEWHANANLRQMPWKGEKDPYKIWISEVILQQTRVEQGLPYYHRFIEAFPTVADLAAAPEQEVFKLWEGLGYYSRCRNLILTAKRIAGERQGKFPNTFDEIKSLKGVGPYTAAAIASFAYNLPYAVLDGNVFRVLARYFGITTPIDNAKGKNLYRELADSLLERENPGTYNQAIMDFGALICKPQQPLCASCIQRQDCEAYRLGVVNQLPVKEKTIKKKVRWFYYFIIIWKEMIYIRKRTGKDIWESLYEFCLIEQEMPAEEAGLIKMAEELTGTPSALHTVSREYATKLSHQTIKCRFIILRALEQPFGIGSEYVLVSADKLKEYPFSALINNFLLEGNLAEKI
jgi:A/G-specific adenine glycosylase